MFLLNFKKEWKMHKSLLTTFFIIAIASFALITLFYLVLEYATLSSRLDSILNILLIFFVAIVSMLGGILPIVIMYKVLKNDLGKNNVQHTIFTPQSILSWYVPKLLFVFLIQGLFGIIQIFYAFYAMQLSNQEVFKFTENIYTLLISTFSMGIFGILTLCMAIYYSFRSKGLSWFLIVVTIFVYFASQMTYGIIMAIQSLNGQESSLTNMNLMWIQYGLDSGIGLLFIIISLYLFDKKIEY